MTNRITEIQVTPIKPQDGLVGFASLVFANSFYLGSIGIFTRPQGGYRLTYPTKGNLSLFYPINRSVAQEIEEAVITKFEEVTKSYDRHN
ncbi:MAG: septation protein SpoVG family protein, partial [bacterium]|nr:septation protein SpoVG family protein [bacterium]